MGTFDPRLMKYYREKRQLTQAQAGELAGLAQSTWQSYETGAYHPRVETLPLIAKALGIKVGDLFGETDEACPPEWRSLGEKLSERSRNRIIEMVQSLDDNHIRQMSLLLSSALIVTMLYSFNCL